MSKYDYITNRNARAFTPSRLGKKIDKIILHHWGARGQTFNGVVSWFCDNPNCQTSAHYVAEDGRVACIVDPTNTAYHAGDWVANLTSLGIEARPEATEGDYETVSQLIADLWKDWGVLPVYPHNQFQATACPGIWNIKKVTELAQKKYKGDSTTLNSLEQRIKNLEIQLQALNNPTVPAWATETWKKATEQKIVDGTRPNAPLTRVEYAASRLREV